MIEVSSCSDSSEVERWVTGCLKARPSCLCVPCSIHDMHHQGGRGSWRPSRSVTYTLRRLMARLGRCIYFLSIFFNVRLAYTNKHDVRQTPTFGAEVLTASKFLDQSQSRHLPASSDDVMPTRFLIGLVTSFLLDWCRARPVFCQVYLLS